MSIEYKIDNIRPDKADGRDLLYVDTLAEDLPAEVDLREYAGEIENQGRTGSCVANACVSALELLSARGNVTVDLSRLFLYYNLREPYANLNEVDKGSYLRDGFKFASKQGICLESTWKFDESKVLEKPTEKAYEEAQDRLVEEYRRIAGFSFGTDADDYGITKMKIALAKGLPVTVSMSLGKSFYKLGAKKDMIDHKYPGLAGDSIGGHAMNVVGYSDKLDSFIVENSWSKEWADNGYCAIKYDVMKKDCNDAWVCTKFAGIAPKNVFELAKVEPLVVGHAKLFYEADEGKATGDMTFKLEPEVSGGTKPYKYDWTMIMGGGSILGLNTSADKSVATYKVNKGEGGHKVVKCTVSDSSLDKQIEYVTIAMVPKQIVKPKIEPEVIYPAEPKVHPIISDVKWDKDDEYRVLLIGLASLVVGLVANYYIW